MSYSNKFPPKSGYKTLHYQLQNIKKMGRTENMAGSCVVSEEWDNVQYYCDKMRGEYKAG